MDTLQFFEDNGYVVMRDFWPDGELDALFTNARGSQVEKLENFACYVPRQSMARFFRN